MSTSEILLSIISAVSVMVNTALSAYVVLLKASSKVELDKKIQENRDRAAEVKFSREQQQQINEQRDRLFESVQIQLKDLRHEHIQCREESAVMKDQLKDARERLVELESKIALMENNNVGD